MYRSTADDRIAQARHTAEVPDVLPWRSFAAFFRERVGDAQVAGRTFLSYYDDDRQVHRAYTYAEFGRAVERMAAALEGQLGLTRGDSLATLLFNHDQTVVLYFAAWTLGVAVVPVNVDEPPEKKRYIIEHSEAAAAVCWKDDYDELTALQHDVPSLRAVAILADPGELNSFAAVSLRSNAGGMASRHRSRSDLESQALIVYTSGTTGAPKGVILTARNLLLDTDAISGAHGFGLNDRLMCVLPIHHVNGTVVTLMTPFYYGGSTVLNRRFKAASFWRRVQDEQVSCVSVVPTLLEFLLDANEDVRPLSLARFGGVICGAGPLLKETAARFEDRFGIPIRHGYGLSETTCYSCFLPNDLSVDEHRRWLTGHEFPSIGVPLRHCMMTILNADGKPAEEGARGEICIRGGIVCAGYFKREDANEAAFQWGWFRSGDEGCYVRDERGRPHFFISGRLKELIIRGGVNISPLEIDEVLKAHPGVKFGMAVPFDNRYYGEEIAAYVVPRDGAAPSERDLLEFCKRLPFWKRPKVILFGEELCYTSTGKPKRLELKARLAQQLAAHRDTQFKESRFS